MTEFYLVNLASPGLGKLCDGPHSDDRTVMFTLARKFYLASRFSRREELETYATDLEVKNLIVTSRWIRDPSHRINHAEGEGLLNSAAFNNQLAVEDLDDVLSADTLIYFSPGGRRGGCHVEFGIALGTGKSIVVVGQREHIFCHLKTVDQFDTWADFLRHLTDSNTTKKVT